MDNQPASLGKNYRLFAYKYGLGIAEASSYYECGFGPDSHLVQVPVSIKQEADWWLLDNKYRARVDFINLTSMRYMASPRVSHSFLFKDPELATLVKLKYG